jgi:FG-GAP-like repeat
MKTNLLALSLIACCAAGAATPNFLARRDYLGLTTQHIAVADTNSDGFPDVITLTQILLGNGNGTFRPGPAVHTGLFSDGRFLASDVNGDGKVDLVVAGSVSETPWGIGICLGNGDGTFQPAVFYQAGSDPSISQVLVADFNQDGWPDVAAIGPSGVWLYLGEGGGAFQQGVLIPVNGYGTKASPSFVAADFNGDGHQDLAVATDTGFTILPGNGNGSFGTQQDVNTGLGTGSLETGDFNVDGHPDIIFMTSYGAFVYLNNGTGGFPNRNYVSLPLTLPVAIGDVNGDGIPDLVDAGVYIALGKGNGAFKPPIYYPVEADGASMVVLADLRNNGRMDIVADAQVAVSVLLNQGKGHFEDGLWIPLTGGGNCGAAADYNGDGKPDLAVNNAQGVTILLGTGKSATPFTTGATLALSNAGCMVTGDLNGDGIPDLLVPANGTVVVYLGNGDGTFTQKGSTATPTGGYLALGDFNHDGKLDFATSGNLLALSNGDGTFQAPAPFVPNVLPPTAKSGFTNLAAADLNGDGWPDVVLGDAQNYYLYVLINDQHGGFTQSVISSEPAAGQIAFADLNRDGKLDMVTAGVPDLNSLEAHIYLGDGQGGFTYKGKVSAPLVYGGSLVAADVNGDGIVDINEQGENTLGIFFGKGDGTFRQPFYIGAGANPGDLLVENLHGQAPSAGLPDFVLPDRSGGVMVLINLTR